MKIRHIFQLISCLLIAGLVSANPLVRKTIEIEGSEREYLVYEATTTGKPPLVFAFHGHGGTMRNAARTFRIHELWPEAFVVYMQGLKTPGRLTDPEGKRPGWQHGPGEQDDRDLKFFDAVYDTLKDKVDIKNVFSTGHSNGGGFTYLLWHSRGDHFRAMAPSSAGANKVVKDLKSKPAIHYAGKQDPLVKYSWQIATLRQVHSINKCQREGEAWHSTQSIEGTIFSSENGTPLVTLISDANHKFPKEASELFVRFFKEQLICTTQDSEQSCDSHPKEENP